MARDDDDDDDDDANSRTQRNRNTNKLNIETRATLTSAHRPAGLRMIRRADTFQGRANTGEKRRTTNQYPWGGG